MSEFKVGDKVVVKNAPFCPDDHFIQTVKAEDVGQWYMHSWRLAEPAEVQAGFRIDKPSNSGELETLDKLENHISPNCKVEDV